MIEEQWNFVGGYIPVDEEDWDGFFLSSNKMPYEIVVCYRVQNKDTKKIHAECTSRQKAKAQLRILEEAETKGGNIEAGLTGNYYLLQNGDCWTIYDRATNRIVQPCVGDEEQAKTIVKELNTKDEEIQRKKILEAEFEKKRGDAYIQKLRDEISTTRQVEKKLKQKIKKKSGMSWREFWSQYCKGKKFGSRSAVNEAMKKASAEWRAKYKK